MKTIQEMLDYLPCYGDLDLGYSEAIDGGYNYGRPSSGYRFFERESGECHVSYEETFDTGDGWDSMDYSYGTYPTKQLAILSVYCKERLEDKEAEYERKLKYKKCYRVFLNASTMVTTNKTSIVESLKEILDRANYDAQCFSR